MDKINMGTKMKNELMIAGMPTDNEMNMLLVISRNAAASGLYSGVGSEQKIFMILLAARELGILPMTALNGGLWNIQGKIEISARLMNAMVRRAGHSIKVIECNSQICVLEGTRSDNGDTFRAQFSMEDARTAGLAGRGPWKSYAEDMLYSRAMSRLARRLFSDVIGTAYVEGEIRDATNTKSEKFVEAEVVTESDEEKELILTQFSSSHTDLPYDGLCTYITKYASYWKKSIQQAVKDYEDPEKFVSDFSRWTQKQNNTLRKQELQNE